MTIALVGTTASALLIAREKANLALEKMNTEQALGRANRHFRQARGVLDEFGIPLAQRLGDISGAESLRGELLLGTLRYYEQFIEQASNDASLQADLAATHFGVGVIASQMGNYDRATQSLQIASRLFTQLSAADSSNQRYEIQRALCFNELGAISAHRGQLDEARERHRSARAILNSAVARTPNRPALQHHLALTVAHEGLLWKERGDTSRARQNLDRTVELRTRLDELLDRDADRVENQMLLAVTYHNLSGLLIDSDLDQAEAYCRQAIGLQEQISGEQPNRPRLRADLALSYNNLGAIQSRRQEYESAVASYGDALSVAERLLYEAWSLPQLPHDIPLTYNNLGHARGQMGQTESSLLAFRRAAEILDGLAQKHHADAVVRGGFGGALHNQATALSKLGRYQEAAESFEAALGHQRYAVAHAAGLRAYREHLVQSLRAYAVLLNQLGQSEKAAKIELELGEIELADQTPRRKKTRPRQAADHTLLVPDDESS